MINSAKTKTTHVFKLTNLINLDSEKPIKTIEKEQHRQIRPKQMKKLVQKKIREKKRQNKQTKTKPKTEQQQVTTFSRQPPPRTSKRLK